MSGVTDSGWVTKTEQEIFDELAASVRSKISPSLNVSPNAVLGRLLAIFAAMRAEDWEVMTAIYGSQYEEATGASLDSVSALTGTERDDPSFSTVTATVNMDNGTSVTAGEIVASVAGNPNATFTNVEAFTADATGDHSLLFQATESGPINAPAGSLTVLEENITGVNSITNPLDADPGETQEQDPMLRLRRRRELTAQGTGTEAAVKADVDQVSGVESAAILVNRTSLIDGALPPNSFEIVAFGGDDQDIGQAIWDSMPSGIQNVGTTTVEVEDQEGNLQPVYFTRPTEKRALLYVALSVNSDTYAGDAAVKTAISEFTNGSLLIEKPDGTYYEGTLNVGTDLILSSLYAAIHSVSGVQSVTEIGARLSTDPPSYSLNDIPITPREIVAVGGVKGIQTADIDVVS